jgi:hypothetical protein
VTQSSSGGLGPRVPKPAPPPAPEWRPVPDKPLLEQNERGQLRTRLPTAPVASSPFRIFGGVWVVLP